MVVHPHTSCCRPAPAPAARPARPRVTAAGNGYVYAGYVARGYFSLVALNFTDTTALDRAITADLRRNHHYRIVQVIPYGTEVPPIGLGTYIVWQYQPGT